MRWWGGTLVICALSQGACLESNATVCGDLVCSPGLVCHEVEGKDRCVAQEQLDACEHEEVVCDVRGEQGECRDGACILPVCNDGILVAPEECDGELLSADDCTDLDYYDSAPLGCDPDCTF